MTLRTVPPSAAACLAALLVLSACADRPREDATNEGALEQVRDTLGEDSAASPDPEADAVPPGAGAGPEGDPAGGGTSGSSGGGADDPAAGQALPPWTTDRVAWEPTDLRAMPVISELRRGRSDGYDRWVVEMRGGDPVPGYRVEYIDKPLHECGSGEQVHPVGDAWLELRMEPAQGHTDEGRGTLSREVETPGLTRGLHVYRTCDFEGIVTLVLAVDSPEPFRVFHLTDPARVVVDVRH